MKVWFVEPETSDVAYLDRLGSILQSHGIHGIKGPFHPTSPFGTQSILVAPKSLQKVKIIHLGPKEGIIHIHRLTGSLRVCFLRWQLDPLVQACWQPESKGSGPLRRAWGWATGSQYGVT